MKYILVLALGFLLHKGLEEVYDHFWNKGFTACKEQYILDMDNKIEAPLTKRFECTYKEMGHTAKLAYVLLRPHWSNPTGSRWYY